MTWSQHGSRMRLFALAPICASILLLLSNSPFASARSRDFSEPEEPDGPPLPRAGPLVLSVGIGIDTLAARWYRPGSDAYARTWQLGPELRLAGGILIRERMSMMVEALGAVPLLGTPGDGEVLRFGDALAVGGLGLVADWLPREDSPWDLHIAARRCWATPWGFLFVPGVQLVGERPTLDAWLFEAGIARPHRSGHVDRSWTLSVTGGVLSSGGREGWMAGLSFIHSWSRS
jgi:hypothetical protein